MTSTIDDLIHTSVQDCKSLLAYQSDLTALRELEARCQQIGHKTREKLVKARIRQVARGHA